MSGSARRPAAVRLVLLDVDGVLTDGRIVYDSAGAEAKAFHVRDGQRIKLAIRHGLAFGIITGRSSEVVRRRAAELGIAHVHQGAKRKLPVLEALLGETGLDPEAVAYVGDDIVDLPVMRRVGWAVAVADAPEAVRAHAHWVTRSPGGRGAVAEVVERILEAKGLWQEILEEYLR